MEILGSISWIGLGFMPTPTLLANARSIKFYPTFYPTRSTALVLFMAWTS